MKGRPDVSVVIPYFDDQARLTLLLRSLQQQEGDVRFDVVVADDGSPEPPTIPTDLGFDCTVVTQPDEGFRAAAARNLGAEAARGEFLIFLDGDTYPTSRYLSTITRQLRESDEGHGVVVVGRRRHADLRAADEAVVLAFLRGDCAPDAITLLEEPTWLLDGYARTDDLRSAGDEDFRLIISAVLAADRRVWTATGGFDPDFIRYGGEDWDFGWRSWLSGADFCYQSDAVAWHDGPDAGGRGPDPVTKNTESLRLAQKIALPSTRGTGLILRQPEIVVRYIGATVGTAADAAVVACVAGLLDGSDAAVWFTGCSTDPTSAAPLPPLLRGDPRVHQGNVPKEILDRARFQVWIERPVRLTAPLHRYCDLGDWAIPGTIRGRRTRTISRGDPASQGPADLGEEFPAQTIADDVSLERWWGGW